MRPYEWMVKYTPQTEWIEKRGVLLWLAVVFGGLGGGLYLISLAFDSLVGMFIGWIIVTFLKGGTHMAYLGHPMRFWRGVLRLQTSWISRGLLFVALFAGFGALQLIVSLSLPGTGAEAVLKVLAGLAAFLTAIYPGFAMNRVTGIPFWNNAILPVLFVSYGFLGGFGLMLAIALAGGGVDVEAVETGTRFMLLVCAVLLATYLLSATYAGEAGKVSVMQIIKGNSAALFWVGVFGSGILVPGAIAVYSMAADGGAPLLLAVGIACELAGSFSLRYSLLKEGIYAPLVPLHL